MGPIFDVTGRVALVTGGGQAIGLGIARRLAAAGARLVIYDRDAAAAEAVAVELSGRAFVGDVTDPVAVQAAVDAVERDLGSLDIVVNNAGVTGRAVVSWELDPDEVRRVLDINLIGPFLFSRAAIPGMMQRGWGRIVNIASIAGKEGNPTLSAYSASKAALINLTKAMAKELCGKGDITVNAIAPAVIQTPMVEALPRATVDYMVSKIPMGRTGRIEEVAGLVHYLASPEAAFCTGQCYDLSGGRATY
jgi:3-oxoacyl-[acyl-carrier protein] reductase